MRLEVEAVEYERIRWPAGRRALVERSFTEGDGGVTTPGDAAGSGS
jgi:hypothetical protein